MGSIHTVFKKIFSDEKLTKAFSEKESEEELFEFCKSIDEECTEADFDEYVFEALENYSFELYKNENKLDDDSLQNVAGGAKIGNLVKKGVATSLATFSALSGVSFANQPYAAGPNFQTNNLRAETKESKFKKTNAFFENKQLENKKSIGSIIKDALSYFMGNHKNNNLQNAYKKEVIQRNRVFEKLTGVQEEYFRVHPEVIKKCIVREPNGDFSIVNVKTGEKFSAGKFQEYSIEDLDKKIAQMGDGENKQKGTIVTISLSDWRSSHDAIKKVDVANMQIDPKNKDALFGVASNFNVLETLSGSDSTSEKRINEYVYDHTQGPFASLSAMAGLILRTYGQYYSENTPSEMWKQTDEHQVNLLGGLDIKTANGYVTEDSDSLYKKLSRPNAKKKFKIGYHKNICVTGGYSFNDEHQEYIHNPNQVVDQAFCAALNLDGYEKKGSYSPTQQNKESAKKILEWTYEGILKAAYVEGKKKVILPLIGCGVFNNDPSWIAEAIEKQKDFIKQSGMVVVINLYSLEKSAKYDRSAKMACEKFRKISDAYFLINSEGDITLQKTNGAKM